MLAALALAGAIARCAPAAPPHTMAAIVQVESGGDPLAIGDNTRRASYHPNTRESAIRLARRLLAAGHSLDLGIAQINDANLARLRLTLSNVFDPCVNVAAGARVLAENYAVAAQSFGPGAEALRHAIGMYNTGELYGGVSYARRVARAAGAVDLVISLRNAEDELGLAQRSKILVAWVTAKLRHHRAVPAPEWAPILVPTRGARALGS